jgi:cyclophilin family peptidyl-prolyl cis-trans isomerase
MIKKAILSICILSALLTSSCQERYPDLEDGLYAEFVTNKDTMVAKLYFKETPVTVANFVALAEGTHPLVSEKFKGKRYYDSTTFHRVINNFMIQGGDPTATGSGSPGYKFEDEFVKELNHSKPGVLSMANSGPNTNGSQFFITEVPTPYLDAYNEDGTLKECDQPRVSCHAVFGEIVKGMEVQDSISNVKVVPGRNKPVEDVVILELNIVRKGAEAKKFDAPKVFNDQLPKLKEQIEERKEEAKRRAEEALKETKAKAEIACKEWLEKNDELKGRRIESPTGMAMIFTEEGSGEQPNSSQMVNIDCAGYFESGELFWTTWKDVAEKYGKYDERQDEAGRYAPFTMPYNETAGLVAGFREAMLNMKIGDKARVFIPYYLGYGEAGRAPVIPPKTNLVFDIELVGVK